MASQKHCKARGMQMGKQSRKTVDNRDIDRVYNGILTYGSHETMKPTMAAVIELHKDGGDGDPASHGETTTMSGASDTTADNGCDGSCPN
jgi:hypothetical protein